MAEISVVVNAPVERLWAILADGGSYDRWVVGAKSIRSVDPAWPQAGSSFHHSVGIGPLTLKDSTQSVAVDAPRRLVLEARARPLGRAEVAITLADSPDGTTVTMDERAVSPSVVRMLNPLLAPLIRRRNLESLRRLSRLASADRP